MEPPLSGPWLALALLIWLFVVVVWLLLGVKAFFCTPESFEP